MAEVAPALVQLDVVVVVPELVVVVVVVPLLPVDALVRLTGFGVGTGVVGVGEVGVVGVTTEIVAPVDPPVVAPEPPPPPPQAVVTSTDSSKAAHALTDDGNGFDTLQSLLYDQQNEG